MLYTAGRRRRATLLAHWLPSAGPPILDPNGRWVIPVIRLKKRRLILINTYAAPDWHKDATEVNSFTEIQHALSSLKPNEHDAILLLGDLNCTPDPKLDRKSGKDAPREREAWNAHIAPLGLFDTTRTLHPSLPLYTYRPHHQNASRIDHALGSLNLQTSVLRFSTITTPGRFTDDHCPIVQTSPLSSFLNGPLL